jgi:hypothetical protein
VASPLCGWFGGVGDAFSLKKLQHVCCDMFTISFVCE